MKKAILQLILLVALFFSCWFALSRIDFTGFFRLKERIEVNEKKLGALLWKAYAQQDEIITAASVTQPVNSIFQQLCEANRIDTGSIHLYIVSNDDVNAFAFPGNRLVVHTGLIRDCENAEELAGVLAHEMAHIQQQHVMKKLSKEMGIGILAVLTSAGGNSELIRQILRTLSSTAYDRSLESEADETAVQYLCAAEIDASPMASFFLRLSKKNAIPEAFTWISTHPDLKERAANVLKKQRAARCETKELMPAAAWKELQLAVQ